MGKHKLWNIEPKIVRDTVHRSVETADQILPLEQKLILQLEGIDSQRLYVRLGYKALRPFCVQHLRFTRTQAQRIATEVRRYRTTFKIGHENLSIHDKLSIDGTIKYQRQETKKKTKQEDH